MRMLASAGDWERHQRREVRRVLRQHVSDSSQGRTRFTQCLPLYPGSMLFNQIAILGSRVGAGRVVSEVESGSVPRFESLDAVYAALGLLNPPGFSDNTLLIDCQSWWPGLEEVLRREIGRGSSSQDVVVLSGPYSQRIQKACEGLSVQCRVIRPQWRSVVSLLSLYRSSGRVLFVDTARSLDAAMIGINCSLVVGNTYAKNAVFPALDSSLSQLPNSGVILAQHHVNSECSQPVTHSIVENSIRELLIALSCEHRLSEAGSGNGLEDGPVVRNGVFWQHVWKRRIDNLSVSTRRKSRKLIEDPRAFFRDSTIPCSGAIASLLPETTRSVDLVDGGSSE